jgi:uncharacterized membrane protein
MNAPTSGIAPSPASRPGARPWPNRVLDWAFEHWLLLVNLFLATFVGLAVVSPVFLALDWDAPGRSIFLLYGLTCHQLPSRSFFLFGHQIAFCQRDVAMYGSMLVSGLVYSGFRQHIRPLPWQFWVIAILPMAIDGGAQLAGFRESNWSSRVITGTLFGVATVWLLFPNIDRGMKGEMVTPANANVSSDRDAGR